jgi:Tfp pilus assembly PilM family ATPase
MTRILGIDVGSFAIKIAEVEVTSRAREIVGLYELQRQADVPPNRQLADFLLKNQIHGERIALGLGATPVYIKILEFPFSDKKRLTPAVRSALEDVLPFEITEKHILEFKPLLKHSKLNRFIAGLLHEDQVNALNKMCDESQIMASGFFVDAEALGQLALTQHLPAAHEDTCFAVVDLGHMCTKVAIVQGFLPDPQDRKAKMPSKPGEVADIRSFKHGTHELLTWLKDFKNMSEEEARQWLIHRAQILSDDKGKPDSLTIELSNQIKVALRPIVVELYQAFQAYKGRTQQWPKAMYLTGGLSEIAGLREFLSEELRLSTHAWPVFSGYNTSQMPMAQAQAKAFATALGLVHRYTFKKPIGWLNFRRSAQASRKVLTQALERLLSPEFRPLVLSLCLALVVVQVYGFAASHFLNIERAQLKSELESEFRRLNRDLAKSAATALKDSQKARALFEKEKSKRQTELESQSRPVFARPKSDILLDVSSALTGDMTLKEFAVTKSKKSQLIEGLIVGKADAPQKIDLQSLKTMLESKLKDRGYEALTIEASLKTADGFQFSTQFKGASK